MAGRRAEIVRRAGTEQRPIVRLDGVEDREGADALRGMALTVDGWRLRRSSEGEWWAHELEGCAVVDGERVHRHGQPDDRAALVRGAGGATGAWTGGQPLLVPMVKDAIRRMAVAEGRIEIDMGFLGDDR